MRFDAPEDGRRWTNGAAACLATSRRPPFARPFAVHCRRAPVCVRPQHRVAALALQQRRHIAFAVLPGKDQRIAFPVAECLMPGGRLGTIGDPVRVRDGVLSWLAAKAAADAPSFG